MLLNTRTAILVGVVLLTAMRVAAQGYSHGTVEVVLTSPDAIVLAIDSKEVSREFLSDGTLVVSDRPSCKTRQIGPYYIALAGISRDSSGFDTLREAAYSYREGDTLDEFASKLLRMLPLPVASILEEVRAASKMEFDKSFRNQDAVQLTLLGMEHERPRAIVLTFRASQTAPEGVVITPRVQSCPGTCKDPNTIYLLGLHDEIDDFLYLTRLVAGDTGAALATQLIQLEYDAHPDIAGGAVTVIRATRSGVVIEQPGVCAGNAELPRIGEELHQAIAAVTDILVHEEVVQYSKRGDELRSAVVSAEVRVVGGVEEYSWFNKTGKRKNQPPEPWCGGELTTMLRATLQEMEQGSAVIAAGDEFLVTFHSPASEKHWQVVIGATTYPLAFEGSVWLSRDTGQLLRIQWVTTALRLPDQVGITRIEWNETFSTSDIAGRRVLTTDSAFYRVLYNEKIKRTDWTETRFSNLRRFGSTVTLLFAAGAVR